MSSDYSEELDRLSKHFGCQYFDRQGNQITLRQWLELYEGDREKREETVRVAWTAVGDVHISTVWLGLDHNYERIHHPELPPLIYETMIFGGEMSQEPFRWATEQEAREGHEIAVAAVRLQTGQDKA